MQYNTLKDKTSSGRILLLAILAITTLILAACNSSNSAPPEQVIVDFYKALERNDTDAAVKLIYNPTSEGINESVLKSKFIHTYYDGPLKNHKGLKNLKITEVKFNDDKKQASINIINEYNDCISLPYILDVINNYGKWFINVKKLDQPPKTPKNQLFYISFGYCDNKNTQTVSVIDFLFYAFNILIILLHLYSMKEEY